MTSTRFHGLVIGGPLALTSASCLTPTLDVVDTDPPRRLTEVEATFARFRYFRYRHHEWAAQGAIMGFWIPGDKSPEWAMQELVNAYTGAKQ